MEEFYKTLRENPIKLHVKRGEEPPKDRCFVCGHEFKDGEQMYELKRDIEWCGNLCSLECNKKYRKWFDEEFKILHDLDENYEPIIDDGRLP